ncbi:Auxilin-related protein 1 [Mucuna pruriens]|uniref:Auxilin-related protein 1 n=1 Tax=Mucuna pruriens TaxID=157652 RepID=A0A371EFZ3_MUCPR|nr:Auxilin-related protein 1 [Mucuna pruriens]
MDEFGVLTQRYGLKPQGKSAPMARASSKRPPNVSNSQTRPSSNGSTSPETSSFDFNYGVFSSDNKTQRFDDFFGGNAKSNGVSFDYDSIFAGSTKPVSTSSYVDDIFGGMHEKKSVGVDDLLDKIGGLNANAKSSNVKTPGFDDLIPGFGVFNNGVPMNKPSVAPSKPISASHSDPFLIFETASSSASSESFLDSFEEINKSNNSNGTKGISASLRSPPKPMSKVHKSSASSSIDELEDFAMGGVRPNAGSRKANDNAAETKQNSAAKVNNGKRFPAANVNQANDADDLESFFSMSSRSNSVPKSRTATMDHMYNNQMNNNGKPEVSHRVPSGSSASVKKSPATTSFDDLSLIFGGSSSSEFSEVEGETEERRKARLGRHQRTQERALKAVADMNERDLQTKMEQEEKRKIADIADVQIKRWAAGKEGNMRALLSTLQYLKVLGNLKDFLGLEISMSCKVIHLCQQKYTLELLHDTGFNDSKPASTPMDANLRLNDMDGEIAGGVGLLTNDSWALAQ